MGLAEKIISITALQRESRQVIREQDSNELIFAIVGHVGSGTSTIAKELKLALEDIKLPGGAYDVTILKARDQIVQWGERVHEPPIITEKNDLATATRLQDLGDKMRQADSSAVAKALIREIRATRAKKQGQHLNKDAIIPDGKKRAYILDSIRHPAEVHLLKSVYEASFALVGVVCDEDKRIKRIGDKFFNGGKEAALRFMRRDARDPSVKYGQRVSDAFHMSDFFIENSVERYREVNVPNKDWKIVDELGRLIRIITHQELTRPRVEETAMYEAYGAAMRSACLSRQVGAALVDKKGNIIAIGTNEVPMAGGGVYGEGFDHNHIDERCAYWSKPDKYCSNTKEQNEIIQELIDVVLDLKLGKAESIEDLKIRLRDTRVGGLLEFSRAVHAEMDALLSAARKGLSPMGGRLFVTTYPCHYCARHLVTAGIDEVQFIEPYPKSQALKLHWDSITADVSEWIAPSDGGHQMLFRPFTGIAPRLYSKAFIKDRDLKDDRTGK